MVFLSCVEKVSSDFDTVLLKFLLFFKSVKLFINSIEAFFSKVNNFCLFCIKHILSDYLIGYIKVFIKPLCFWNEMGWDWVWSEDFSWVHVLVVAANSLLKSSILNWFFIFHCSSSRSGSWSYGVKATWLFTIRWFHFIFRFYYFFN